MRWKYSLVTTKDTNKMRWKYSLCSKEGLKREKNVMERCETGATTENVKILGKCVKR